MKRHLPWLVVALAGSWVIASWRYPKDLPGDLQVREFATVPVVHNGRVKPIDTTARNVLRIVSNKETFVDSADKRRPAAAWLLDVITPAKEGGCRGDKHAVFRIEHPQLLDGLGLKSREGSRYSFEEFSGKIPDLRESLKRAHDRQTAKQVLDAYEHQLLEFWRHINEYAALANLDVPHIIPPNSGHEWSTLAEAVSRGGQEPHVVAWRSMLQALSANDVPGFNRELASYEELLEKERPGEVRKAAFEARFNEADPFNACKWFYLLGFVLTCLGFLGWSRLLSRTAWGLMAFTFIVHTFALGARIYLSGRPPVTNLYSSAVFIGWAAVLIGLVLERIFRLGAGNIIAAIAGFVTLQIAHILAADGDTMEVLVAVLDTQFWLATHVVCITLGYATTYVAGLLGFLFVIRGTLTTSLTPEVARNLNRMTYGTICFATFFSFVGTVLGGLWADDSWGRFWGWDAKENGALMIVLWNALVLHARWGGLVRERGLALLTVFGNIIVSWSWFGVNQLGVGLHSYGKASGITVTLLAFAASQLVVIGLGWKDPASWKSPLVPRGAGAGKE
jgi:ABC-type transport system involved in cytochrome c biogenesis permease subunit